jgi:hypothetical protein
MEPTVTLAVKADAAHSSPTSTTNAPPPPPTRSGGAAPPPPQPVGRAPPVPERRGRDENSKAAPNTSAGAPTQSGMMWGVTLCNQPLTTVICCGHACRIPLWLGALVPIWLLTRLLPLWLAALVFFGVCAGGMVYLVVSEIRRRRLEKQRLMEERMRAMMVSDLHAPHAIEGGNVVKQQPSGQIPALV